MAEVGKAIKAAAPKATTAMARQSLARIVWEQDGEEQFQTVSLEWIGRDLYVP